jgi:hypothetical protein
MKRKFSLFPLERTGYIFYMSWWRNGKRYESGDLADARLSKER